MHSKTEEEYNVNIAEVRKRRTSTDLQTYGEKEVHTLREHFVFAWIKSYENNLGCIGYQGAEANHSSIVAILSDGGYLRPGEQLTKHLEKSKYIAA